MIPPGHHSAVSHVNSLMRSDVCISRVHLHQHSTPVYMERNSHIATTCIIDKYGYGLTLKDNVTHDAVRL